MDFPVLDLYAALGDACTYTPAGGGASALVMAVLEARPGDVLGGEQVSTRYEVRLPAASVSGQVARGARFFIKGVTYEATAKGQPFQDVAEIVVPVKVAS